MTLRENAILCQYGALPFLVSDGELRVLLVTTRGRRQDWIIPKGWPIRHLTAAATAAREAYEEAGLIGTIIGDGPCGSFLYEKQKGARGRMICKVSVFLFAVERQLRKWPEKSQRTTRWLAPEEASLLVAPTGLVEILRADLVNLLDKPAGLLSEVHS
jgi:8-oxo-dGTP pyrophosphatase MutT (NUDIX family)